MLNLSVLPSSNNRRWSMDKIYEDIVKKLHEMTAEMNEEQKKEFIACAKGLLLLPEGSLSALE